MKDLSFEVDDHFCRRFINSNIQTFKLMLWSTAIIDAVDELTRLGLGDRQARLPYRTEQVKYVWVRILRKVRGGIYSRFLKDLFLLLCTSTHSACCASVRDPCAPVGNANYGTGAPSPNPLPWLSCYTAR